MRRVQGIAMALGALLVAVIAVGALYSVGHRRRPNSTGPALVVFIVDRTASTNRIQAPLVEYATDALTEYAREGPIHVVLINLDQKPTMDVEESGDLTSDQVDDVIAHVKRIDYSAKGTDIMGAFDLAYNYYTYEKKRPRAFRILCFTDGLIESPPGQKFRPWSTFNQDKFRKAGASIGIYFLAETAPGIKANSVRQQVEGATRNLKCVIEEEGEAKDDVKNGTFHLPGLAQ